MARIREINRIIVEKLDRIAEIKIKEAQKYGREKHNAQRTIKKKITK